MRINQRRQIDDNALSEGQEVAETWGDDWDQIADLLPLAAFKHGVACGWGAREMRDREPTEVGSVVFVKYKRGQRVAMRTEQGDWEVGGIGENHRQWTRLIENAESWERLR